MPKIAVALLRRLHLSCTVTDELRITPRPRGAGRGGGGGGGRGGGGGGGCQKYEIEQTATFAAFRHKALPESTLGGLP